MFSRTLCAASLAVLFLTVSRTTAQTDYPYNPACMLPENNCSAWRTVYTRVFLPEYPGCELILTYETRECPDPSSPQPVEEIIIREIHWPTLVNPNDSTQPCYNINSAYLNTPAHMKLDFLHVLFQDVVEVKFREWFEHRYEQDSVAAVIFPNFPEVVDKYTFLLCGNGKKTYRMINGVCMAAVTKPNVQFHGILEGTKKGEEKGASPAGDSPQSTTNYMRVRYIPCEPSSQPVCCIQLLQFCRNPVTWETEMQRTATLVGPETRCTLSVVEPAYLQPGETSTGCRDYCLDYHPEPLQKKEGSGPNLSERMNRERGLRVEDVRYDVPGTANR